MSTHNVCFEQKFEKYQNFLSENFHFYGGKIFSTFEQACFHNVQFSNWNLKILRDVDTRFSC